LPSIAGIFKVLVYIVLLSIVGFYAVRHWSEIVSWLQGLFPQPEPLPATPSAARIAEPEPVPQRTFASFRDPFANKAAPAACVVETFQAVEAWAREHRAAREPEETPAEFAKRLARQSGLQGTDALADAYGQVVYGRQVPPKEALRQVAELWPQMRAVP
jgi:hypothetical protein